MVVCSHTALVEMEEDTRVRERVKNCAAACIGPSDANVLYLQLNTKLTEDEGFGEDTGANRRARCQSS